MSKKPLSEWQIFKIGTAFAFTLHLIQVALGNIEYSPHRIVKMAPLLGFLMASVVWPVEMRIYEWLGVWKWAEEHDLEDLKKIILREGR